MCCASDATTQGEDSSGDSATGVNFLRFFHFHCRTRHRRCHPATSHCFDVGAKFCNWMRLMVAFFLFVMQSSLCRAAAACAETPARYNLPPRQPDQNGQAHCRLRGPRGGGGRHGGRCGDGAETEGGIIMVPYPKIDKY